MNEYGRSPELRDVDPIGFFHESVDALISSTDKQPLSFEELHHFISEVTERGHIFTSHIRKITNPETLAAELNYLNDVSSQIESLIDNTSGQEHTELLRALASINSPRMNIESRAITLRPKIESSSPNNEEAA